MRLYSVIVVFLALIILLLTVPAKVQANENVPIVPKEKITLFNGKDFIGWKLFLPDSNYDVTKIWSIKDGVISCMGQPAGYMRTEKDYANYLLHIQWRWVENGGNSGVLIHMNGPDIVWPKSLECQLFSANAGDFWVIGGVEIAEHAKGGNRVQGRRTVKLKQSSEKLIGQWNTYDIICKDDWVVVLVNGVLQNVATKCSESSGKICLQSEGAQMEFRNIYIEPLE